MSGQMVLLTKQHILDAVTETHVNDKLDIDLWCIFSILGTPTEESWPGVSDLEDFGSNFPFWKPMDLKELVPRLDPLGLDLLRVCLVTTFLCLLHFK